MKTVLGVVESGRQPQTAAAVAKAQRMREEAEAAARAEEEAAQIEAAKEELEELNLVDELPGTKAGYGFEESEEADLVVPEATLPPSGK